MIILRHWIFACEFNMRFENRSREPVRDCARSFHLTDVRDLRLVLPGAGLVQDLRQEWEEALKAVTIHGETTIKELSRLSMGREITVEIMATHLRGLAVMAPIPNRAIHHNNQTLRIKANRFAVLILVYVWQYWVKAIRTPSFAFTFSSTAFLTVC